MVVDLSKTRYKCYANTADGAIYDITKAITLLDTHESRLAFSRRVNISAHNQSVNGKSLADILALGAKIQLLATTTQAYKEIFQGIVWDWRFTDSTEKTVTILSYDKLIYLQKSEDDRYYTSGKSTEAIIKDICAGWRVPLVWRYPSIIHAKTPFRAMNISDMILQALNAARDSHGKQHVVSMKKGTMYVQEQGTNTEIYVFDSQKNVLSIDTSRTLDGIITKVLVIGATEADAGRAPVEAVLTGDTKSYGTLQRIITRSKNTTLEAATKQGQQLLDDNGKPVDKISFMAVDVPWLLLGDKIRLVSKRQQGDFFITSLDRNCITKVISMEVSAK